MKKKLNKIAALVLALVMVITGFVAVPQMDVQAANESSYTVKTNVTEVKPGDKIHVECWFTPGKETMMLASEVYFDPQVYTYVKGSMKTDPNRVLDQAEMIFKDDGLANTKGGVLLTLNMSDDYPIKEKVLLYTFDLVVKDNVTANSKTEIVGKDHGSYVGNTNENADPVPENTIPSKTVDKNGKEIVNGKIPVAIELSSLKINKEDFTMTKGTSETLTVTGTPAEALEGQTITWKSSNKDVVTVDSKGKVEAVGVGNATITATAAGKSDSVKITVNNPLKKITVDPATLTLKKGTSKTLSVKYDPADTTDNKAVTWESSDKSVATVDANGKVTALKDGSATITAKVGKLTATCALTVQEKKLTGISLDKTALELSKGQSSEALKVIYTPADTTDDKTVTWSSADEKIATVKNGVVTAKATGTTKITATVGTHKAECTVTVNAKLTGIKVTPDKVTVEKGQKANLNVTYLPADTTDEKAVTWKSENESVATVDENGVVTAVAGGKTKVIATAKANNKITAVCEVKVPIHTESIALNKTEITDLLKGKTEKLEVSFIPSNTEDSREVKWTSSAADIAAVDANGTVKALKEGTATITATTADGKHTASCTVTVKEIHLTDVKLDEMKNPSELFKGEKHQIKIGLDPIDTTDNVIYTFASSDEKVVSVDKNGMVTALKNGKATITITVKTTNTDFEKTLTYDITVEEIPLESIEIKGDVTSLEEGKTTKLNVVFNPTNTTDDKTVVWSSSDTKVATVDANGVVKAVKAGNVKITAKVGDKTAEYALKVTAKANGTNNKNEKPADGGAVKTGDSNHISGFVVAMLLSIAAIVGVVIFKKRTHR
ncbi:Ig-like domain-containing protein [[Ruminococcus] torques]|uniref:Ig-like domain-containing protein n=1 Tax=[Ruminococcus] torques TaxID=33039 RepID=UPI0027B9F854|nr:Ig-like domain-containing protein [[Ruminococcus] torques]